jgi:hypothetical protein
MPVDLLTAGAVLVPLGFGLVPAFLPRSVPIFVRWCAWLILLAASITFVAAMSRAPQHYGWLALGTFCLSTGLSLWVLVKETRRSGSTGKGLASRA